jgi:archaellum biogenesis ATPase FlaH
MQEQKIGKKELMVRDFFENHHDGRVPNLTVQQLYQQFMLNTADANGISYGLFNGVVKKIRFETGDSLVPPAGMSTSARPGSVNQTEDEPEQEAEIMEIGSMQFPSFRKWMTGTLMDKLWSDHDAEGGLFAGTANIIIGESGVGKSTVTLDMLAKIKQTNPGARVLYISSEMTRNDIFFYYQKTPIISTIPTLLLMDHITGRFDRTLEQTIRGEHDVILIDSYQDIIVKLKDVLGWKSTKAEAWLTNLIVDAADRQGKSVLAIQHMTKSGQYVGSTYLKHATQSMMEIKFDDAGRRFVEFSKNRRGGSLVNKRMYYSLVNGELAWDKASWERENLVGELVDTEQAATAELENRFNDLFLSVKTRSPQSEESTETINQSI